MNFKKKSLLQRLKEGDYQVLNHLWKHLLPRVIKLTKDKNDAEDIIQEALLRLWQNREKVESGKLEAYAYMIARNVWREQVRQKNKDFMEVNNQIKDREHTPIQKIIKNESLSRLSSCLEKLPKEAQEFLERHHIDGIKIKKIAEETGIRAGTMRKRFFKWRHLVKECVSLKMSH